MKNIIISVSGIAGSVISYLVGGWDTAIIVLGIFMVIDLITGWILAIFHKSKKTDSGGLSSKVGFIGLAKKCFVFLLIIVAHFLDVILGVDFVRDGVCIAFISNETISIIENCGLLGVPIPAPIKKAIDLLQDSEKEE